MPKPKLQKSYTKKENIANEQCNIKNYTRPRSNQSSSPCRSNPFFIPDRVRVFSHKKITTVRKSKPETFIMSDPKTICDIDETFYKTVEGRPLRQFCDVKVYIKNIKEITLFKTNAAFAKEYAIQIDTSLADENRHYEKIYDLFLKTKINYINFVKQKYNVAKRLQEEARTKSEELSNVTKELSELSFIHIKLRNESDNLIASFEILSKYGQFLYSLSPHWWRLKYDQNFEDNKLILARIFSDTFSPSSSLLTLYKTSENLLKQRPTQIYFKKPQQLIQIFDNISGQCLTYMQKECYYSNILKSVLNSRELMKIKLTVVITEIKNLTAFFEKQVKWLEEKELACKNKFNRILYKEFKKLFCSFESIHLHTCVQFVHTQLLGGPEDPKDNVICLGYNIENLYITLTTKLDYLDQDIVNKVTQTVLIENKEVMQKAYKAQRILREHKLLKKSLLQSFEPPKTKHK